LIADQLIHAAFDAEEEVAAVTVGGLFLGREGAEGGGGGFFRYCGAGGLGEVDVFFWLAEWTVMRRDSSSRVAFSSIQIGMTGTPEEVSRRGMVEYCGL
jgi:hypothetical protein